MTASIAILSEDEGEFGESLTVVVGDGKRFTAPLVVPDLCAIGRLLELSETPFIDDPSVARIMREGFAKGMSGLSSFERRKIAEKFAPEIDDLYAQSPKRAIHL